MEEKLRKYGNYMKSILEKEKIQDSYTLKIKKNFLENIVFKINKTTQGILSLEIYQENKILKHLKKSKSVTIYFLGDYLNLNNSNKYYLCYYDDKNQFLCTEKLNSDILAIQKYVQLDFLIKKIPEIYENAKNYFDRKSLIEMDQAKNNLINILYSSLKNK